jgi:hypothetical protein
MLHNTHGLRHHATGAALSVDPPGTDLRSYEPSTRGRAASTPAPHNLSPVLTADALKHRSNVDTVLANTKRGAEDFIELDEFAELTADEKEELNQLLIKASAVRRKSRHAAARAFIQLLKNNFERE